ncbi:MAG: carboxylesterase family protein [Rhodococcus sp. (in: high G+C Gram-positive bacteria)]|nr:carboxylesterase family protein [Rhodococcus sp. (in: high G+C Gram-positive bacteria)]MDI6629395.1 carboxylesterase family protein [Rhodococcus sp. (in: high G+C Gram-positive bacteria)]
MTAGSTRRTITGTTSGDLDVIEADGLIHARGIPYATAMRFRKPQPVNTPGTMRDATRRGPACIQIPSRLDNVTGPIVDTLDQSEDCLVLSVTAPVAAEGLPVMVWLHGGGYVSGGGEAEKYDADHLVREGVVVVSVTFRLGGFGYLTPKDTGDSNIGVQDQIEALRWVSLNIARFGGDPTNVTLFGQSAGGDAILSLMACEAAAGLFTRAIVQSAPLGLRSGRSALYSTARKAFAARFSTDPATAPASDVLDAERAVTQAVRRFGAAGGMPFGPVAHLEPISGDPDAALRDTATRVELLIGHTKDDAAPFVDIVTSMLWLNRFGIVSSTLTAPVVRLVTNLLFGVDSMVKMWHGAGGRVASYRVDWAPKGAPLGACHCIELPLLFGEAWSDAPMLAGNTPPTALAARLRGTWAAFAREGVAGLPARSLVF